MSVDVHSLAINYIEAAESAQLTAHFRQDLLPVTAQVALLIEQLHLAYNGKPAKGYAGFSLQKTPQFPDALQSWQSEQIGFVSLAETATALLVVELTKHQIPETGYVMLCHYRYLANEYLLIAMLGSKEHFSLTADLQLASSKHLDIARMQLAARIDLSELQSNPDQNKYISFIRGRAGRKVADFFLDFLGAEEGVDAKVSSKIVLASVEEYLSASDYDVAEKNEVRKQVYQYCEERAKQGQDVQLQELSATVDSSDDNAFVRYCQERELPVAEQFPVDVKELKTLVKFSGAGAGLSLSFEQKLLGERVQYDAERDVLIIKGTPPNLRDQLQKFIRGYSSFEQKGSE
jgi:nucleoid-associated protein